MRPCPTCDDKGWVCENHADRPWDGVSNRHDACGCGAGMPCKECVPEGEFPADDRAFVSIICGYGDGTVPYEN